ncbi:unnamed protein product [Mytilus coruscus]|uniref:Uncharacterized protein n=1 Tax=Mytilus coruscus TaxID=42192 RepID=A0A6J8ECB8_MYTCO|nr:unnamed protein product [Mytilus coruscus]
MIMAFKYYLIDYDDRSSADITLNMIMEPRKADYTVGENVLARYPSYGDVHKGTVVAIDGKVLVRIFRRDIYISNNYFYVGYLISNIAFQTWRENETDELLQPIVPLTKKLEATSHHSTQQHEHGFMVRSREIIWYIIKMDPVMKMVEKYHITLKRKANTIRPTDISIVSQSGTPIYERWCRAFLEIGFSSQVRTNNGVESLNGLDS